MLAVGKLTHADDAIVKRFQPGFGNTLFRHQIACRPSQQLIRLVIAGHEIGDIQGLKCVRELRKAAQRPVSELEGVVLQAAQNRVGRAAEGGIHVILNLNFVAQLLLQGLQELPGRTQVGLTIQIRAGGGVLDDHLIRIAGGCCDEGVDLLIRRIFSRGFYHFTGGVPVGIVIRRHIGVGREAAAGQHKQHG